MDSYRLQLTAILWNMWWPTCCPQSSELWLPTPTSPRLGCGSPSSYRSRWTIIPDTTFRSSRRLSCTISTTWNSTNATVRWEFSTIYTERTLCFVHRLNLRGTWSRAPWNRSGNSFPTVLNKRENSCDVQQPASLTVYTYSYCYLPRMFTCCSYYTVT